MVSNDFAALTADIVAAHVSNNPIEGSELPALIKAVHEALADTARLPVVEPVRPEPAVPIRSSVKPDYLVCLEDGKQMKMLKRHLRTAFDMTPDEYRKKWGLPRDYPMVAPNYAEQRRGLAHAIGLGRRPDIKADLIDDAAEVTPALVRKPGRPKGIAAAKAAAKAHLNSAADE